LNLLIHKVCAEELVRILTIPSTLYPNFTFLACSTMVCAPGEWLVVEDVNCNGGQFEHNRRIPVTRRLPRNNFCSLAFCLDKASRPLSRTDVRRKPVHLIFSRK
jgi:hypothetical protein